MKRFIVLFITVFVCCSGALSCGTQRNLSVSQETEARHDRAWSDTSSVTLDVESMVERMMAEAVRRLILQDIELETESLSEPDSTGRQHVKERTRAKISTSIDESGKTASGVISVTAAEKDSIGTRSETSSTEGRSVSDAVQKTGMAWWQKTLMWSGIAALAFVAIWVLLKFIRI